MQSSKLIIFILTAIFLLTLGLNFCQAGGNFQNVTDNIGQTADLAGVQKTGDLTVLLAAIIKVLLGMIGMIFFILIIYGGFSWMTSSGNDTKITKAKNILIQAIIGLLVSILAYGIADFVAKAL